MGADGVAAEFLVAKPPIAPLYWPVVDNCLTARALDPIMISVLVTRLQAK